MKQKTILSLSFMLVLLCSFSFIREAPDGGDLRYHQITFKASHNSYDREETITEQLTFNPIKPSDDGCLGIELDIWRNAGRYDNGRAIDKVHFTVDHDHPLVGKVLAEHLLEVKNWHNNHPKHPPVLITLDVKSKDGLGSFHEEIDTYLKLYFGEDLLFKPNQLMYNSSLSLVENVIAYGWPKLTDTSLAGKFIFCLSGYGPIKTTYANIGLSQRFCFSDQERRADKLPGQDGYLAPPTTGNFVFFNFHIYNKHREIWLETIPPYFKKNLITRAYIANSESNFNNCIKAKVSAIATDKIRNHHWAKVSNTEPCVSKLTPSPPPVPPVIDKRSIKNVENNEYRANQASQMQGNYESPKCDWIFEPQPLVGANIYALRNAHNNQYLDCSITSMSSTINDNCQRWRLIPEGGVNRFFIQNVENEKYLTKRASKLAGAPLSHEIHVLLPR